HELLQERQRDLAGGAVALLGDDQLDGAFVLPGLVHFRAVQEDDGVGVLFEAAAFAEVGEARLAALAVLGAAVELGQCDDGDLQFAGEELEPAGDSSDLLLPALFAVVRLDELQIVDKNQLDADSDRKSTRLN